MDKQTVIIAASLGGLLAALGLMWAGHAYRVDEHTIALFFPKRHVVSSSPLMAKWTEPADTVEDGDDTMAMNLYWLARINGLRAQKNLKPLALDPRLMDSAHGWALHMGTTGVLSHERPNGESPFTATSTENIGRAYADTTPESLRAGLDQVLAFMVDEGPDGAHYQTIFSDKWTRYGGGFFFEPVSERRVRVYMAFHYGSAMNEEMKFYWNK